MVLGSPIWWVWVLTGDGSLKSQPKVRIRAMGYGKPNLPALMWADQGAEYKAGLRWHVRLWVCGQGAADAGVVLR